MAKVWITKYALTKGIYEAEVNDSQADEGRVLILKGGHYYGSIYSPHWHKAKESAIAQAEKMCTKRIESLKKQIAKLEKIKFGGLQNG